MAVHSKTPLLRMQTSRRLYALATLAIAAMKVDPGLASPTDTYNLSRLCRNVIYGERLAVSYNGRWEHA